MWILWSTSLLLLVWSSPGSSGCGSAHGLSKNIKEFCSVNSTHSCSEIWKKVSPECYVIGAVLLALILFISFVVLCCCSYCYYYHRSERNIGGENSETQPLIASLDLRNRERIKQEEDERVPAHQLVEKFIQENGDKYELSDEMSDLGCRLQKYWYRGYSRELKSEIIITVAPISKNCPVQLNTDTVERINQKILPAVCKHSTVHPILGIHRVSDSHVIVVQQLTSRGSLRDLLYKSQYALDWSLKYSKKRMVLKHKKIALYGRQLLEAMVFLYEQGFPALGHIHTGNILVSDHGCTLGGIDNSLLGYKSSIHRCLGEITLPYIDVIMFGRVIFEMASEKELHDLIPDEQDLSSVGDKEVRKMLKSIFEVVDEGMFLKHSVEEIMQQLVAFFKPEHCSSSVVKLSDNTKLREILEVSSPRKQPKMTTASQKDVTLKLDGIMKKLGYAADSEEFIQIGWRVGKYWKLVSSPENSIMTFAKVSKTCPIFLTQPTINTINGFLKTCSEYQVLHPIHEVQFCSGYVTTTQPLQRTSLNDVIFQTDCLENWSEKLEHRGKPLKRKIFLYSKQILQAVLTLYEAGFPPLGSIQTGNIFVDGDVCQLGGYENTLLGYRSHFHEKFSDQDATIEAIDVVMFGHVVFEMGSGRELETLTPSEEDYQAVHNAEVKRFLQLIFKMKDGHFIQTMKKIYESFKADKKDFAISVSEDMKYLLSKVSKGKVRKNTAMARFRAAAGNKLKKGASAVKEGASAVKKKSKSGYEMVAGNFRKEKTNLVL